MRSSSRYLILLLGLTLLLAGMLAYEAQRATRSHQVTADRALRDYATVAAWELVSAGEGQIDRSLAAALGPVTGRPAVSPYDSLPRPSAFAGGGADSVLQCDRSVPSSDRYFSLDLRTGAFLTTGADREGDPRRWLRDSLLERSRRGLVREAPYGIVWMRGAATESVALYGIKSLRYSGYAVHDAPIAVYGLVTCPAALAAVFREVLAHHALLPRSVTGGLANADLATVEVADPAGQPVYRAGPPVVPGAFAGMATSGSFAVRIWLPATVAGRLVVAGRRRGSRSSSPSSRSPPDSA